MPPVTFRNLILRRLSRDSIERLQLKPSLLERGKALERMGHRICHVCFLEAGIASMTAAFDDGSQVEIGLFGREAITGVTGLMGQAESSANVFMQISGQGYLSPLQIAREEFARAGDFQDCVLRCVSAQWIQTGQTAGCNARHNLQQRLSRWLLACMDRAGSAELNLTQDYVAMMLGVERPAVSIAASRLQESGFIEYRRGRLKIIDRKGLLAKSCECYRVMREHQASLTGTDATAA
jgi:CRP-like cAMP-binding protein